MFFFFQWDRFFAMLLLCVALLLFFFRIFKIIKALAFSDEGLLSVYCARTVFLLTCCLKIAF